MKNELNKAMDHSRIKSEDIIEQAVLKQLSPDDKEEFKKHLLNCDECRNELLRTKLLLSVAHSSGQSKKHEKLAVPFFIALLTAMLTYTRKHAVAISVVLVLIVSAVVLEHQYGFISPSGTDETHIVSAEAYSANNYLESIISTSLRSTNQLTITSPNVDHLFSYDKKSGIPFSLLATMIDAKDKEIEVKIFSNEEEDYLNDMKLYSEKVDLVKESDITTLSLQEQLNLKQGLYYFVLQYKNEVDYIYVGKFSVK